MSSSRPKVVLFDIGGVCVLSPFRAILDYETRQNIPQGWINHAISASSPSGAWPRLERGEIPLDQTFFSLFAADLTDPVHWHDYNLRLWRKNRGPAAKDVDFEVPPPPIIDAEELYWSMMSISRHPDPNIYPALLRLRRHANNPSQQPLIVAALSNTSIFPPTHPFSRTDTPEGRFNAELKSNFDVFVSSAHVGMRKPDLRIYEYAVKELDTFARQNKGMLFASGEGEAGVIEAQDIVFLDDIGANLRTARELGMRTIKVKLGRTDLAVKELEEIMGLDLSSSSSSSSSSKSKL